MDTGGGREKSVSVTVYRIDALRICKGVKYKGEILGRDIGIFFFNTAQQPVSFETIATFIALVSNSRDALA